MGQIISTIPGRMTRVLTGTKRKYSEDVQSEEEVSPAKKPTPSRNRFVTLCGEHLNSDITVRSRGRVWHLHKCHLVKSPYFKVMFHGSWVEANQTVLDMIIPNDEITVDSLDAVFVALYSDVIDVKYENVMQVLATATFFHIDWIIDKCADELINNLRPETVIQHFTAACEYGVMRVKYRIYKWLKINLLTAYAEKQLYLREIPIIMMRTLVSSTDLYVIQTEFSLYILLRTWMFLQLHPNFYPEGPGQVEAKALNIELFKAQNNYFPNLSKDRAFIFTPEGRPYLETFQKLRTQFLTNHAIDLSTVYKDNILPKDWLRRHIHDNWQALLRLDHPTECRISSDVLHELSIEKFFESCMRVGRHLVRPGKMRWRWTGFNFGLDLVLIIEKGQLTIQRLHRRLCKRVLSSQRTRTLIAGVSVTSIGANGKALFTQTSPIFITDLQKNDEMVLLNMDPKLVSPMLVSVKLLAVDPADQDFKQDTSSSGEAMIPNQHLVLGENPNESTSRSA